MTGNITGTVFNDYNGNGTYDTSGGTDAAPAAVDTGLANITVTAFDSIGANRGSVTTNASGVYALTASGTGPYRLEFTTLPAGYTPSARSTDSVSGGSAVNTGSTVQFLADGITANVNLALNRSVDYCQDNPTICSQIYGVGAASSSSSLFTVSYNAGSTRIIGGTPVADFLTPTKISLATSDQVGTTFGLASSRSPRKIFAAAYLKKHAKFGPGGTGAIYVFDRATAIVGEHVNLNTIFGANTAGINPHNTADYGTDNGNATFDGIGKIALGGLAINSSDSLLYTMNLANKTLYEIPVNATPTSANIRTSAFPATVPGCTNVGDVRPFPVTFYEGLIYIGAVCSANASDNPAVLQAYIYTVNPATLAFSAAPVFQTPLNYNRRQLDPGVPAEWRAWKTNFTNLPAPNGNFSYPQPMFTDIDFDRGNLILSIRDRMGDQTGYNNASNPSDVNELKKGITAGDILRACGNPTLGWTIENNGRCGGGGNAPQNSGQGPGEGEYYYQEDYHPGGTPHDEVANGAAAVVPGHNVMVASIFDPAYLPNDNIFDSGGFRWFVNSTGAQNRGYLAYEAGSFGKANGLGNVIVMCESAPLELGNRVWRDANGNGVQDPGELPIAGVTVRLYNVGNVQIATAVADVNGEYYFISGTAVDGSLTDNIGIVNGQILPNAGYQIRFDNSADYSSGGALNGLFLTLGNSNFQSGDIDSSDSDAASVVSPVGSPSAGTFPVITVTTGTAGTSNHTLDTGFSPAARLYSIGNRVWIDTNNNRRIDLGENGAANVSVSVFLDANGDGQPDNSASPVQTVITDTNGYYRFDGLPTGNYVVRVNPANFGAGGPLQGYLGTSGNDVGNTDTGSIGSDNGGNPGFGTYPISGVLSNTVVLGGGSGTAEPTGETDSGPGAQGTVNNQANVTIDFGFLQRPTAADVTISGRVTNTSGRGIGKIYVVLTEADGRTRNALTNAFGYYGFTDVQAGQTMFVRAYSPRYTFEDPIRVFNLSDAVENLNFIANQ